MNDTLEDELRVMFRRRGEHLPTSGPGLEQPVAATADLLEPPSRRDRVLVLVVAASVVLLGGVIVVRLVNDRHHIVAATTDAAPLTAVQAASGHWTMDVPPGGLQLTSVNDDQPHTDGPVTRVYASASITPERDPAVLVTWSPSGTTSPVIPDSAVRVDVGGYPGRQWEKSGREMVAVDLAGAWYLVETAGIANPVALAATAHRSPDNYGAVIDTSLLPPGVSDGGAGTSDGMWLFNTTDVTNPIPSVHWESPGPYAGVFYQSIVETPTRFTLHRIEYPYTTIEDITVAGHLATKLIGDGDTIITWNDGNRTTAVRGFNVTPDLVSTVAASLRPASDAEWQTAKKQTQLRATATSPATTTGGP